MQDLLSIGTNRRESMIGTGIGLGLSGYSLSRTLFSPNKVSGLALWLDSSDSSTLFQSSGGTLALSNGDPIGQWQDKSGNGNHATQSDGLLKPQVQTNSQASKPGVNFPDSTDYMNFASRIAGIKHIFIVAKRYTTAYPDGSIILRDNSANDKDGVIFGGLTSGTYRFWIQNGSSGGSSIGNSGWYSFSNNTTYLGEIWADGTNRNLRVNSGTSTSGANIYDIAQAQLGYYHYSPVYYFAGIIYEMIFYTQNLTTSNIFSIQAYLNGKWGIY